MSTWRGSTVFVSSLLGAVCLGLAMLIHDELTNPPAPPAAQPAPVEAAAMKPLPPEPVLSLADLDFFSEVVERPVFSPTRRPVEAPAPPPPEREEVEQAPEFSLAGIVISEKGRFVLALQQRGDGGVVRVGEGRSINGWTVARVEADRAVFRRGEAENLMVLEFYRQSDGSPNPPREVPRRARSRR